MKIIIPARYASSRFPGKPLVSINGLPMIQRVWLQAMKAAATSDVFIATDDKRIEAAAQAFGAQVIMTAADHQTGTDRLAEAVEIAGFLDEDIVVNVQGDEPLIDPALIELVAQTLEEMPGAAISTAAEPLLAQADINNPNIVKLVTDKNGMAHYFSRAAIPFIRDEGKDRQGLFRRHIGIYGYRVSTLKLWPNLEPAPTEQAESLEQLRAMWHGLQICVADYAGKPAIGVDTPEDVALVEAQLARLEMGV